jgi:LRR receptor-like serine/threonine-protein kinase FLS2
LILDSAGYGGELSPYVGNLTELRILQLSGNAIGGRIPGGALSGLARLTRLDLSANRFSGSIPSEIGELAKLRSLDLSHNRLRGELPRSLARLGALAQLSLQGNGLAGAVPDLTGLEGLRQLDLSGNKLSGTPPMRRLPSSVCSVSLRNNSFSGRIPSRAASRLVRLAVLDLGHNRIGGRVPGSLLAHPNLQQLNLSGNMLSEIPARARALCESPLVALDLSYNLISGRLPAAFARMHQLSSLSLRHNLLHGTIPPAYGAKAASDGVRLLLDGNYLVGPLPPQLLAAPAASLADNCFTHCPFALCQGHTQKSQTLCRLFNPPP